MYNLRVLVLFIVLTIFPNIAKSDMPYIYEAGLKLQIGMHKNEVFDNINNDHKIVKNKYAKKIDSWFINVKKTNEVIAQLNFLNNKLSLVWHNIRTFNRKDKSFNLGKTLFSLLSNETNLGTKNSLIKTNTCSNSSFNYDEINIIFQNKKIRITLINNKNQQTVQVSETIFK